jgi:hypothetical protein
MSLVLVYTLPSDGLQVQLPITGTNYLIDWNDEGYDSDTLLTHTYSTSGTKTIEISGSVSQLNYKSNPINSRYLTECVSFGGVGLTKVNFANCINLESVPNNIPGSMKDLSYMFSNCDNFNSPIFPISSSKNSDGLYVVNISQMFAGAENCNINLSNYTGDLLSYLKRTNDNLIYLSGNRDWMIPYDDSGDTGYMLYGVDENGNVDLNRSVSDQAIPAQSSEYPEGVFRFHVTVSEGTIALVSFTYPNTVYCTFEVPPVTLTVQRSKKLTMTRSYTQTCFYDYYLDYNGRILNVTITCSNGQLTLDISRVPVGNYTVGLYRTEQTRAKALPELMETMYLNIEADPVTCFKEGTRILTSNGYVPIEKLRKGTLIKTLLGYKPMCMMSKNTIEHGANPTRVVNQLYKCSKATHPVFKDLVLTGSHAILVDEKQEGVMVEGKYKLPAFMDKNAVVYEVRGVHTIYHIALEDANEYVNYGIYANGLLVESCSKYVLKNKLGMSEVTENVALSKIIYPNH